jgi:biopolymer transport protein ExbD
MNLHNFRTFLAFFACLSFATFFTLYNFSERKEPKYSFIVKVPKEFNPNFTDDEFFRYFSDGNYVPMEELQKRKIAIPNVCGTLIVSIQKDGKIKLNMQNEGSLLNPELLITELKNIIVQREENKVYEPNSDKIVKTVVIKSNRSIKYGEVAKVIDAVKSSGAEPIVLQIDDLPN